jgi:hypothetical protein
LTPSDTSTLSLHPGEWARDAATRLALGLQRSAVGVMHQAALARDQQAAYAVARVGHLPDSLGIRTKLITDMFNMRVAI